MLEQILRYLKNPRFYLADRAIEGEFEIKDGMIDLPLLDGQYFLIEDSVFNDGVWQYPENCMTDEVFRGRIVPLSIPKAILEKIPEMEDYERMRSEKATSGADFQSESFDGYSYQAKTNADGTPFTAIQYYKDFLKQWRCI